MIGFFLAAIVPFLVGDGFSRNLVALFLAGLVYDLTSGWTVGLSNLFFSLEILIILVYQVFLRLRIRVKFLLGVGFGLIYLYAAGRIFL